MVSTQDKLEILETLAAANRAADAKDVDGMSQYYAEDGFIEGDMQAQSGDPEFKEGLQNIFDNEPGLKRHIGSGHLFAAKDDGVLVKSLLTVLDGEEAPQIVATADIEDELRKSDDGWKITRHAVHMDPGTKKAMQGD